MRFVTFKQEPCTVYREPTPREPDGWVKVKTLPTPEEAIAYRRECMRECNRVQTDMDEVCGELQM